MDLSFILPIYNVEAYLPQCVDSILEQIDDNCEIILVDDGTKDRCNEICDRYAAEDPRIRVIHKENGGLSSARNAGMDIAQGDYVCFIDSDDYIRPNTVPRLLAWIRDGGGDVCFLHTDKVYPDGSETALPEEISPEILRSGDREQILRHLATRPTFPGSAWGKLYRRQFLQERGLRYPADRRLSEDLTYCIDVYLQAEKMDCLTFPFYCYRQNRPGSITQKVTPKYYFDTFLFVEEMVKRYGREPRDAGEILAISTAAFEYAILVWQAGDLQGEDAVRARTLLKEYRWLLRWGQIPKVKLVRWAVALLGFGGAARLVDFYQTHRA